LGLDFVVVLKYLGEEGAEIISKGLVCEMWGRLKAFFTTYIVRFYLHKVERTATAYEHVG